MTDDVGAFLLVGLPPGDYVLTGSYGGLVSGSYGSPADGDSLQRVTLTTDRVTRHVSISLHNGAFVEGMVSDEHGRSVPNAVIQLRPCDLSGNKIRCRTSNALLSTKTDGTGAYRIVGVPLDLYSLSATATMQFENPAGSGEWYELENIADAITPVRFSTATSYRRDLRLKAVKLVELSGTLLTSRGSTATAGVVRVLDGSGRNITAASVDGHGTFSLRMPRGCSDCEMVGSTGGPVTGTDSHPEAVRTKLPRIEANKSGLVLRTTSGRTIAGQVEIHSIGTSTPPFPGVRIYVKNSVSGAVSGTSARASADGTFQLEHVFEDGHIVTDLPPNGPWFVHRIVYNGRDITDFSLSAIDGRVLQGITVDIRDRPSQIVGSIVNSSRRSCNWWAVVALLDRPRRQANPERYVRISKADAEGNFVITGLPAGRYAITSRPRMGAALVSDPDYVEDIIKKAYVTVTLSESESQSVQVRCGAP